MGDVLFYFPPVIIAVMVIEAWFIKHKKDARYQLKDTAANIIVGLGMLFLNIILKAALFFPFAYVYQFRLFTFEKSWWLYVLLVIADDYVYYWFHRISHESRFFWASHETHHSSTRYNFSTAVRQTWTGYLISWVFWLPLVVIGFPPEWVVLQQALNLFYQIFIHTEAVDKLGFIEWVMNTPSHHRVHHATNLSYLDKNYGGIFIVWDRLHGTFEEEKAKPIYGTLDPVKSYNPVVICFHMWMKLVRDVKNTQGFINKLKIIFWPPGWHPLGLTKTTRQLTKEASIKSVSS